MTEMHVEMVKVKELRPHPRNPRVHPEAAIAKLVRSIETFGFTNPVLVSADGLILAGHARVKAAEKAGITEVPVIRLPLSGAKADAYLIADNRLQDETDWDLPSLKDLLGELDTGDFDLRLTGFDLHEIEMMMGAVHQGGNTEDDALPDEAPAICQPGDLWLLGEHRLLCGDSTKAEDVVRLMDGQKADMVFTDPPYGISLDTDYSQILGSDKAQLKAVRGKVYPKVVGDDKPFDPSFLLQYFAKVKDIFLWGADYYHNRLPEGGCFLVWDKSLTEEADRIIGSSFEICWSKQRHKKEIARIFYRGAYGANKDDGRRCHPTQKPVRLAEWFIGRWGEKAIIIADIYLGSGSTLIACEKLGRKCYGMEIDPHYCDVIVKRWEDYTGKKATKA